MRKEPASKSRIIFWKFSLSYFVLLLIPLLMGLTLYNSAFGILEEQIIRYNALVLRNSGNAIENSIQMADDFIYTLNNMTIVHDLVKRYAALDGAAVAAINASIKKLPAIKDSNQIISSYYLYNSHNQFLTSPGQGFLNIGDYYQTHFQLADYSYAKWLAIISDSDNIHAILPHASTNYNGKTIPAMLYLSPLPSDSLGADKSLVLFYLNENQMLDMLKPAQQLGASSVCILDRQGLLLTSLGDDTGLDLIHERQFTAGETGHFESENAAGPAIVNYYVSEKQGWIYLITMPRSVLTNRIADILRTIVISMMIMITCGFILAFLLNYYNRKPLVSMANRLKICPSGEKSSQGGLWSLDSSIHHLVANQEILAQQLQEQRQQLKTSFYIRLINGDFADAQEIDSLLNHLDIRLPATAYRGVYLEVRDQADKGPTSLDCMDQLRTMVVNAILPCQDHLLFMTLKDPHHIILLYIGNDSEAEEDSKLFRDVYTYLKDRFGLQTVWYLGPPHPDLLSVHQSFDAARHLMDSNPSNDENFLVISKDMPTLDAFDYSYADEEKLSNLLSGGNYPEIRALLQRIRIRNFQKRKMPDFIRQLLYHRMLSTLVAACDEIPVMDQKLLDNLDDLASDQFFELLDHEYRKICERYEHKRMKDQNQLAQQIADYLTTHYHDANLSLTSTALQFGLNETYLSVFFKERQGENFSVFLENLRIKRANELLRARKHSITDIAQLVGYTNLNSFGRAYKRVTGHSPSQFMHLT